MCKCWRCGKALERGELWSLLIDTGLPVVVCKGCYDKNECGHESHFISSMSRCEKCNK